MRQEVGQQEGQEVSDQAAPAPEAPEPAWKRNLRPFQPGQSGNPGGRPKVYQAVSEYIRQLAGPDAKCYVDKLHQIAVDPHRDTRSRINALEILLDRGYGRAPQEIQLSGSVAALDPARLVRLTDAELEQAADLVSKLVGEDA